MRLPTPALQTLVTLLIAWLLAGCGDSQDRSGSSKVSISNELLPVTATAVRRAERPAVSDGAETATSGVVIETTGEMTAADREAAKLAPEVSGWDSERLSELASQQLKLLAHPVAEIEFAEVLGDGFESSSLVPEEFAVSTLPDGVRIVDGTTFQPLEGTLEGELERLRSRLGGKRRPTMRFKPVGVEIAARDGSSFATEVLMEAVATRSDGSVTQINAVWRCSWSGTTSPLLTGIEVKSYREVHSSGTLFQDGTMSVFKDDPEFVRQMLHGIGYWAERLTRVDDMSITGHHGVAVGDVDGDGLEDVYVCDGGGLPNRLYIQLADGTVSDRSAAAQVDFLEDSRSALLIDLDNDGDQDLVVATIALVLFAENDGAGTFALKGGHQGAPSPYSMAAADFDNDGDLDIYVTSNGKGRDASSGAQGFEARSPIPYNDAENGGRNVLLANHGAFRFSDATEAAGLDENNSRWSFAAAWEDYDQDGDADLYVVNDFGRNNLYRNDEGSFRDIAAEAAVEDMAGGMSASWGDSNADGNLDIYVGNMFSAAGNRVTYQRKFGASRKNGDVSAMQRMARGNSLFQRRSDGFFEDVSEEGGVTMGRWAWSSGFVDLNNDGLEDLVVANGYISSPKTDDL